MKKYLLLFLPLIVFAQKHESDNISIHFLDSRKCVTDFSPRPIKQESTTAVLSFLNERNNNNRSEQNEFVLEYEQQSPGGKHYCFHQKINGLDVYQSQIKVNTDGRGTILSVLDNSFSGAAISREKLLAINSLPHLTAFIQYNYKASEMWVPTELGTLQNAYVIDVETRKGWRTIIADNQKIIYNRDLNMYASPPDSTVKGYVFLPDPLTSAGKTYGGIYIDNNDADQLWLSNERKQVDIVANYDAGVFTLSNSFVKISDFEQPSTASASVSTPIFNYTRSHLNFEDVNIIYHISEVGKYVKQMGFNCADVLVEADGHAGTSDNSFFAYNHTPMRLFFGEGGVDDAEDADVCVHEYSHFLAYNAAPNSNVGSEREALDEAFGDYNAASYSRAINNYNWGWVYSWDGHNEYWNGRVVNSSKVYPTNMVSSFYRNAEIWSSLLMQLWGDLGKSVADRLIFQTHYGYTQNMSFLDAANLLLQADQTLYNGSHYCPIAQRLYERGLLPAGKTLCPNGIKEAINSLNVYLIHTDRGFIVSSAETINTATIDVYDLSGKLIYSQQMNDGSVVIEGKSFAKGMYIVHVKDAGREKSLKWFNQN